VERLFADSGRQLAPYTWRGDFNFELRNYTKARAAMQHAIKQAPRNSLLYLNLGESEFWSNHWRAALAAYAKSVELDPNSALAFKGIGWCHYNLDELNEALLAWQQAQQLFERRGYGNNKGHLADTLKGIGFTLLRQGHCERAADNLKRAHEISPAVTIPHSALSRCRLMQLTPAPF